MHCGISGEVCEEPVLSRPSGVVYEKRVILKYIEAEHKDPANGEELTPDDLITVKSSKVVRPRPVTATSVPGLLALFQNEWDALMLETHTLKEHLAATRTELANALYQHDAACRVIARLARERDSALSQLSALQSSFAQRAVAEAAEAEATAAATGAMEVEPTAPKAGDLNTPIGISDAVLADITSTWEGLSKGRKKRPLPEGLPSPEEMGKWTAVEEHALHSTSKPGVLALDVSPLEARLLVTGGMDKEAVVFDRQAEVVVDRLKGHGKKVTAVRFHPSADFGGLILTGSADKTVKLWKPAASSSTRGSGKAGTKGSTPSSPKASYTEVASLSVHASDVTALAIQATGHYFASASKDKTWALHDASSGQCLAHVVDPAIAGGYECLAFHPDGVLLGTGTTASKVRMWDVKTQANVATFEDHTGPVSSLSFSENGYYMASGAADGTVKLWDLRKLKSIRSLDLGEGVQAVAFDPSGQYLGVAAGTGIKVYLAKAWSPVAEFNDHSDKITALEFGHPASAFLATASLDRTVKVYH